MTALQAALAELRSSDPAFDTDQFEEMVTRRYLQVKEALSDRDPDRVAPFVGPGLLQQWRQTASEQATAGIHVRTSNLRVDSVRLLWLGWDSARQTALTQVSSMAATTAVADQTGRVLFGGGEPRPSVEYWTFARPLGIATPAAGDRSACLNCGAPADGTPGRNCRYCGSEMPNVLSGWRLEHAGNDIA